MRRLLPLLSAVILFGSATPAMSQATERLRVAVTLVTLNELRQGQEAYGRSSLASLGDPRRGRFEFAPSVFEPALFASCLDERNDDGLDYCIRFYLTRAELSAGAPPMVVVVFDDEPGPGAPGFGGETMRVNCFGRGIAPADPAAQDTGMWPGAQRMHGMRDLDRDRDALAACISAAASERWTGLREPDPPR